ncbi:MAG: hypothetical protein EOS25_13905 [Mesorhizobium sp.]|uniref:hypothetical protein n=1 Tax=Mesorhizobium sp. TaxID=1871066 RepID=UPI000FE5CA7E|nr:hypothetical protein [Mesorhizobium sp.]RWD51237.1 MAG: hypothetical protein EOS59_06520 [Mesorhizobium sp.]RWE60071.1 MAG: hypothetical protein EOS24_13265 [Mesorhizobium sp.]RWF11526.1 MAG: hypothetical protein EOS69_08785 [Mesorhizobium sp.]RWF18424.1 MAG: hypothetical protein EOS25_13905 [Mesorhizobium sp.]TIY05657.1 MAG: hypothetical protein E5V22_06550 [Mesorhizobium sp.]
MRFVDLSAAMVLALNVTESPAADRNVSPADITEAAQFCEAQLGEGLPDVFAIETVGLSPGEFAEWCTSYIAFVQKHFDMFGDAYPHYVCGCKVVQQRLQE